ncbi:MAG: hypothetical protein HMLKMBBP_02864 [Planctomycetes bacterium]|nr:hypothetical protein [Planctomycetota bacterium]
MSCSSSFVPRVATTSAWVSPRWKIAEPWARGRTPTSISIARISSDLRPSYRVPERQIFRKTFSLISSA